ncbi:MAG: hypothetical protein E6R04_08980 [Spirochaetes bacterium]|nr:MAG: hypothetical protein E6R04_08980 [Spirochaetota bacterium]
MDLSCLERTAEGLRCGNAALRALRGSESDSERVLKFLSMNVGWKVFCAALGGAAQLMKSRRILTLFRPAMV